MRACRCSRATTHDTGALSLSHRVLLAGDVCERVRKPQLRLSLEQPLELQLQRWGCGGVSGVGSSSRLRGCSSIVAAPVGRRGGRPLLLLLCFRLVHICQ